MNGQRLFILILTTILVLAWIVLATKYENMYADIIRTIDPEKYKYPELFCVGFALMNLMRIDGKSINARKKIKEISEIQGKRYAEYYYVVMYAEKLTYGFTTLVFVCLLGALGDSIEAVFLSFGLAGLVIWYTDEVLKDQLTERRDEILADMPQMLSKMTLLVNSGMVLRDAWIKIAFGSERKLYKEMQLAVQEMQNGIPETDAYRNFAERCSIKQARRVASTIIQNKLKGNQELAFFLKEMSNEMWEEKKHLAKRKGEAANSKLMIPTAMIFIGILIMVIGPVFLSM